MSNESGREYLWQGDPSVGADNPPFSFRSQAGSSRQLSLSRQKILSPKHGFARKSQFEILAASDTEASFRLESSEETHRVYPFDFALTVWYTLDKATLRVLHIVKNLGNEEMYFSLGAHPAFQIAIGDFVKFSEYETFTTLLFDDLDLPAVKKRSQSTQVHRNNRASV